MSFGKRSTIGNGWSGPRAGRMSGEWKNCHYGSKCGIFNTLDLTCRLVFSTSFAWIFSSSFKKNCHWKTENVMFSASKIMYIRAMNKTYMSIQTSFLFSARSSNRKAKPGQLFLLPRGVAPLVTIQKHDLSIY